MAKQSGLHQIRGKVGEHSYYKQTGISSGLIRSINQGMSARVKTSEEYANTRLNNSEFAGASNVAGLLGKMVMPKFRPMILPFSQSNMAKALLELARKNNLPWGARVVSATDTPEIAEILSAQSKRDYSEFVTLSVTRSSATAATLHAKFTAAQATLMASLGISSLSITGVQIDLASGKYNNVTARIQSGYIRKRDTMTVMDSEPIIAGSDQEVSEDIVVGTFSPTPELYNGHQFVVFVVMPERKVNDVAHVLQEYCCFLAVQLPSA